MASERSLPAADWSLDGKVAIVTGTSPGGIGEAYALALSRAGADVVAADINGDGAEAVAKEIVADGGRAISAAVDITDEASVDEMVAAATDEFGGVDILVNNAALMVTMSKGAILDYSLEDWNRSFAVNLTGAFLCCRAVVPSMRERGWGRIVNQISAGRVSADHRLRRHQACARRPDDGACARARRRREVGGA